MSFWMAALPQGRSLWWGHWSVLADGGPSSRAILMVRVGVSSGAGDSVLAIWCQGLDDGGDLVPGLDDGGDLVPET